MHLSSMLSLLLLEDGCQAVLYIRIAFVILLSNSDSLVLTCVCVYSRSKDFEYTWMGPGCGTRLRL